MLSEMDAVVMGKWKMFLKIYSLTLEEQEGTTAKHLNVQHATTHKHLKKHRSVFTHHTTLEE